MPMAITPDGAMATAKRSNALVPDSATLAADGTVSAAKDAAMTEVAHLPPLLFGVVLAGVVIAAMALVLFVGAVAPSYWRRSS